ncbi:MAG: Ig-like domain-containing protein [Lachnospiraceae bacterium]|nr:Ig-like domain-containing protein [Lachnospiraceae bacterium]
MKEWMRYKNKIAVLLSIVMLVGLVPVLPGHIQEVQAAAYSVEIVNPRDSHMTKTIDSGAASQTVLTGAMTPVIYRADAGYYFPDDYQAVEGYGIKVARNGNSYSEIIISGTPTDNVTIELNAAKEKEKQEKPRTDVVYGGYGVILGTTTAMEFARTSNSTVWFDCTKDSTDADAGVWYVRLKETDTKKASEPVHVNVHQKTTPVTPKYKVTITAPLGAIRDSSSGAAIQENLSGAMTSVIYKAGAGYYFPADYGTMFGNKNGITVTWNSHNQITVSGKPTGNTAITLPALSVKAEQQIPQVTGGILKISGTTTAMEYASSPTATNWKTCGEGETVVSAGTWYVRYKETDTKKAGTPAAVTASPQTPENPDNPDNPDEPDNPEEPDNPDDPDDPSDLGYSVIINNPSGSHITMRSVSGSDYQTGLTGAMATVTYIANAGYYFPEDYSIGPVNGIHVTRKSDTWLTVWGIPTADTRITLIPAESVDTRPYKVTIHNGTGSGEYAVGKEVSITANAPEAGKKFDKWRVIKGNVTLENSQKATTKFTMHSGDVEIIAEYAGGQTTPGGSTGNDAPGTDGEAQLPAKETIENNGVVLNQKLKVKWKGKGLTVKWGKIAKADGYDIFAVEYGKELTDKNMVKTVKGENQTSATISKVNKKKLSTAGSYSIKVKAYQMINGKKVYIADGITLHITGKVNRTYTNVKSIKLSKKSFVLKKGKTAKIKASIVKQDKKKKLLPKSRLSYQTTNKKVATVNKSGKIKAVKKGTCYIYVTASNGVKAKVKVRVK